MGKLVVMHYVLLRHHSWSMTGLLLYIGCDACCLFVRDYFYRILHAKKEFE